VEKGGGKRFGRKRKKENGDPRAILQFKKRFPEVRKPGGGKGEKKKSRKKAPLKQWDGNPDKEKKKKKTWQKILGKTH